MTENDTQASSTIDQDGDELELLTVPQVAELFNVPTKYVYAKAASGELPSVKIGAYRRFRRSDLRDYLNKD